MAVQKQESHVIALMGPSGCGLGRFYSYSARQNPATWLQLQGSLGNVVGPDAQEEDNTEIC